MKTTNIKPLMALVVSTAILSACEIETHDNGKIDGFWHLESIDTLSTGGTKNTSNDKLFWSVQSKLIELSNRSTTTSTKYIFTFNHRSDSLLLHDARVSDRTIGDTALTSPTPLHPWGVSQLNDKFAVEALNGSKMILKSETLRLRLRKF